MRLLILAILTLPLIAKSEVQLFDKRDFDGSPLIYTQSKPMLPSSHDNLVKSIRLTQNKKLIAFTEKDFKGLSKTFYNSTGYLGDFQDKISSFQVKDIEAKRTRLALRRNAGGFNIHVVVTYVKANGMAEYFNSGTISTVGLYRDLDFDIRENTEMHVQIFSHTGIVWDQFRTVIDTKVKAGDDFCIKIGGTNWQPYFTKC